MKMQVFFTLISLVTVLDSRDYFNCHRTFLLSLSFFGLLTGP